MTSGNSEDALDAAAVYEKVRQVIELMIVQIVTHPDDVVIACPAGELSVIFLIKTNPEDTGRIVGKNHLLRKSLERIIEAMVRASIPEATVTLEISGQKNRSVGKPPKPT